MRTSAWRMESPAHLALLAQSLRQGITVDGHLEAMNTISSWLDTWRHDADPGPWWPQWITPRPTAQRHRTRSNQRGPLRPSWCYGTPGLARAQQIAAVATSDTRRQQIAEHTLAGCLSDPAQLRRITDTSLCHGWASLHQSVSARRPRRAPHPQSPRACRTWPTTSPALPVARAPGSWKATPASPSPCTRPHTPRPRSLGGTRAC